MDYGIDPANRRMQRVTGQALDRLLDLIAATPGTVAVIRAYDPGGPGLLAQGRALWLRHSSLTGAALAAQAFAAGFDYVALDGGPPATVQVAVAAGEQLGIAGRSEVAVGQQVTVSVQPQADPAAVALHGRWHPWLRLRPGQRAGHRAWPDLQPDRASSPRSP